MSRKHQDNVTDIVVIGVITLTLTSDQCFIIIITMADQFQRFLYRRCEELELDADIKNE